MCEHLFILRNLEHDKNMKKTETKKSYTYKPQYGLVVICPDEAEQIKLFKKLQKQGLQLKVVVV